MLLRSFFRRYLLMVILRLLFFFSLFLSLMVVVICEFCEILLVKMNVNCIFNVSNYFVSINNKFIKVDIWLFFNMICSFFGRILFLLVLFKLRFLFLVFFMIRFRLILVVLRILRRRWMLRLLLFKVLVGVGLVIIRLLRSLRLLLFLIRIFFCVSIIFKWIFWLSYWRYL